MKDDLLNLDDLTEEERESILLVLKRNEELQSAQDTRIGEIKSQINAIRMNAVLRQGEDGTKICSRCREPFGYFFNSGEICPQCKCKVCKTCREYTLKGDWICILCYKQRQLKALTGEWLVPAPPEVSEEKTDSLNLSVPELVRKSIRRKSNHSNVSINASEHTDASSVQGDSGNITATSQGSSSPPSHSKNPSDMSLPSINVSGADEEEDEPVDDIVTQPKTPSSTFHQTFGSLFSSFGGSRESIASYYSQAGGGTYGVVKVKGTIQLAVDYKYKVGTLEVVVKQCSELAAVDEKKQRSDPYVKTYLLPDRTRTGKRKTQVKKNSLDPVFNETLRYHLTKSELSNRTLWLAVWNHDRFGRNVFLGEVTLPLTYYNFSSSPQWYNLQEREEMEPDMITYKGDLVVSLKYIPLENLTDSPEGKTKKKKPKEGQLCVLIKEAKNLTAVRANGYSDAFCKGYLLPEKGKSGKQKTEVVKKNLSPKWNYLFTFEDISFEELPDRCVELTVWDHDRFSSNDFLGGVRLNIGTGTSNKKEVNWMDARGEEIAVWQSMIDKPNVWVDATLNLRSNMDKIE